MKVNPKLNAAIDRLADLIENGHLLACTFSDDFINQACDEIEKLRSDLEAAKADTARIDWIGKFQPLIRMVVNEWLVGANRESFANLREAIDAAMKRTEKGNEGT